MKKPSTLEGVLGFLLTLARGDVGHLGTGAVALEPVESEGQVAFLVVWVRKTFRTQ
jgi:hypothetical protein